MTRLFTKKILTRDITFVVSDYDYTLRKYPIGIFLEGEHNPYSEDFHEALEEAYRMLDVLRILCYTTRIAGDIVDQPSCVHEWADDHLVSFVEQVHYILVKQTLWTPEPDQVDLLLQAGRIVNALVQSRTAVANMSPRNPGFVYLLQSPTTAYKIGRTSDPNNRLKTFSVKLPFEVEYICLIETPDMNLLEQQLHSRFESRHINGEWFALTPDDIDYIKGLASANKRLSP